MKQDNYLIQLGSTITVLCNGKGVWQMPSNTSNLQLITDFERWLEDTNPNAKIRKERV